MPTVNVNVQPAIINWALSQTSEEKLDIGWMEQRVLPLIRLKILVKSLIFH